MARVTPNLVPFRTHIPNVRTFQVHWPEKKTKFTGIKVLTPLEGVTLEKYKSHSYVSGMSLSVWFDPSEMKNQMEKPAFEDLDCQFTKGGQGKKKFSLRLEFDNVEPTCDECFHCGKRYSDEDPPKHMSCGHCFCLECLSQLYKESQNKNRAEPIKYQCPVDGEELKNTPETTLTHRDLLEVVRKMRSDEELEKRRQPQIVENPFIPCIESAQHESTKYCMQCKEAFCESCFNRSHAFRIMSGHQSVPVEDKPAIMPMCSMHPANQAYFVCQEEECQDDKYFCDVCLDGNHQHHRNRLTKKDSDNNEKFLNDAIPKYDLLEPILHKNCESVEKCIQTFNPNCRDRKRVMEMFDETMEQNVKKARKEFEETLDRKMAWMIVKQNEFRGISKKIQDSKISAQRMLRLKDFLHPEVERNRKTLNKLTREVNMTESFQSIKDYVDPVDLVNISLKNLDPEVPEEEVELFHDIKFEDLEDIRLLRNDF